MIWVVFGLAAAAIIAATVYLLTAKSPQRQTPRLVYLNALAKYLEGRVTPLTDNSYQILFLYEGKNFIFEDVEDVAIHKTIFKGLLKLKVDRPFTLSFMERPRTAIRSNISSTTSEFTTVWAEDSGAVRSPKALSEFQIMTNNPQMANLLLADQESVAVFARFKNQNNRGLPVMSLEILEGVLTLKFHSTEDLKPALMDLQHNVTRIDEYLDQMLIVLKKVQALQVDQS